MGGRDESAEKIQPMGVVLVSSKVHMSDEKRGGGVMGRLKETLRRVSKGTRKMEKTKHNYEDPRHPEINSNRKHKSRREIS